MTNDKRSEMTNGKRSEMTNDKRSEMTNDYELNYLLYRLSITANSINLNETNFL